MKKVYTAILFVFVAAMLIGCSEDDSSYDPSDGGTDLDTDTDACDDVVCDDPPDPECNDDQLLTYTGEASCSDGVCNYSYGVIDCENGCALDNTNTAVCIDACFNVVCDDHPDNECLFYEAFTNLKTYTDEPGVCQWTQDGEAYCEYSFAEIDCPSDCIVVEDGDDYCVE